MLYKHYSPRCETALFTERKKALKACEERRDEEKRVAVLCEHTERGFFALRGFEVLDLGTTGEEMAANLYDRYGWRKRRRTCL